MSRWGVLMETNQYSVSEYTLGLAGQPGVAHSNDTTSTVSEPFVDFSYDLSPIMMTVAQSPQAMLHFIVRLCAVVGGVLSITRMTDKLVHAALVATGMVVLPPSVKAKHRWAASTGIPAERVGRSLSQPCCLHGHWLYMCINDCLGAYRSVSLCWPSFWSCYSSVTNTCLLYLLVCESAPLLRLAAAGPPAMQATAAGATAMRAALWTHSTAACLAVGARHMQVRRLPSHRMC